MYPMQSTSVTQQLSQPYQGLAHIAAAASPPTRTERLAHCAGLFDGDGCVFISKVHIEGRKNPTYRLILSLVQNCHKTVETFANELGLPYCLVEVKRVTQHNRQVYDLRYDGKHALGALILLHPYLVRKRIEAELAHEFWHQCSMGIMPGPNGFATQVWERRARYCKKLSKLK